MHAISDIEICELIKLFKQSPQLYDNTHPDHRRMVKREETYSQICLQMNKLNPEITIDDVGYYLKVIKTRYKEEYDKVMQAKENGQEYVPTLWYYGLLSFLTEQRNIKPETFNNASLTKPTSSSQCANENVYSETLVNSLDRRPFYKTVVQRSMSSLQLANSIVDKCSEPTCLVFGHFVASELNRIQDPEIRSQAQWDIQEALRRASQDDQDTYSVSRRMYN